MVARSAVGIGNYFFGGGSVYSLETADLAYRFAITLDSQVADVWHQRARIQFLEGNFDDALRMINAQLELHGDTLMASYYIRGLIYGYAKNYAMAEKDFLKFLEWSPNNWAAKNDLAWVYFAQGKYTEAEALSSEALVRDPYNPWLLTMHAMAAYNLGDTDTAKKELELAKHAAAGLDEARWLHAYPGNDPRLAGEGLANFREAIEQNLLLVNSGAYKP